MTMKVVIIGILWGFFLGGLFVGSPSWVWPAGLFLAVAWLFHLNEREDWY